MNTAEFKAWFHGFTEGMDGPPSKKQWERIKEVVAAVDGAATPYWVYLRDYGYPYWHSTTYGSTYTTGPAAGEQKLSNGTAAFGITSAVPFDSERAFYHAGSAEFKVPKEIA